MTETNGNVVVRLLKSLIRGLKMTHKFKIGDEVMFELDASYIHGYEKGFIRGTSHHGLPISSWCLVKTSDYGGFWVKEEKLELINKPKETEMEKPKFKVGDLVISKPEFRSWHDAFNYPMFIDGLEDEGKSVRLRPRDSDLDKIKMISNTGFYRCLPNQIQYFNQMEDENSLKPKVTFIGVNKDGLRFHLKESEKKDLFKDKLFFITFRKLTNCETFDLSAQCIFILQKLGYDIEIIGDGQEEFERLCKEMEGE
jgi:hypothetical protein